MVQIQQSLFEDRNESGEILKKLGVRVEYVTDSITAEKIVFGLSDKTGPFGLDTEAMLRKKTAETSIINNRKRKTTSEIKRRTGGFNRPSPAINRVAGTTSKHDF